MGGMLLWLEEEAAGSEVGGLVGVMFVVVGTLLGEVYWSPGVLDSRRRGREKLGKTDGDVPFAWTFAWAGFAEEGVLVNASSG